MEQGRRLRDLSAGEMLSWLYYIVVSRMNAEQRRDFDYRLMPMSSVVVDDPDLPESMQGLRPPSWWNETPTTGSLSGFALD